MIKLKHTHTHTHMNIQAHTYIYACIYACIHVWNHINIRCMKKHWCSNSHHHLQMVNALNPRMFKISLQAFYIGPMAHNNCILHKHFSVEWLRHPWQISVVSLAQISGFKMSIPFSICVFFFLLWCFLSTHCKYLFAVADVLIVSLKLDWKCF